MRLVTKKRLPLLPPLGEHPSGFIGTVFRKGGFKAALCFAAPGWAAKLGLRGGEGQGAARGVLRSGWAFWCLSGLAPAVG